MNELIAVVSDIHGNLPALEAVETDIRKRGISRVFNLGDHLSGPLWPAETLAFLLDREWIHIAGNHDRNLTSPEPGTLGASDAFAYPFISVEGKKWLEAQPEMHREGGLAAFHGTPSNSNTYLLEEVEGGRARLGTDQEIRGKLGEMDAEVILCGHTHIPRVIDHSGILIVNPGSVGLQAYDDTTPEFHVMETGTNRACYSVLKIDDSSVTPELIWIEYDYKSAVRRAEKNGRPDWSKGLNSSYLSG